MDRCEQAVGYHKKGFNCCQSVLAAFQDVIGLTETQCLTLGGGRMPSSLPHFCPDCGKTLDDCD